MKRSWHYDCRLGQCAVYRLDQAPEVPLQCFRLLQLGVIHPHMQHLQPFRIAGICAETPRTRAPGKQWVCNLPSANVVRTCRTMGFPMITASCSVSRRGAKQLRVEISKAEGSGGGEVAARGLDPVFCYCTQCPWFLGTGMKEIWEDHVPVAWGLCRETHGVEVVGVLAARCILTPDLWASAGMFPALLSAPSTGSASPAARRSASPRSPASAARNAARTCSHLYTKVDTNPPVKQMANVCEWGISCVSGCCAGDANRL